MYRCGPTACRTSMGRRTQLARTACPSAASASGVPQSKAADFWGFRKPAAAAGLAIVVACVMTALWLLGTCVLAVRLLLAGGWPSSCGAPLLWPTRRPRRIAGPWPSGIGVPPPVVLRSPFTTSAALVGLVWPAILLPEEENAAASTRREILVHELAHLARRDPWWKLLGRVGTALLFFQPLLWLLGRRMAVAAEEVCDDYVLDFGCDRRGYARQLVEVAQRYQPAQAVGVGMISLRSWVGRRVVRILDSSRQLSLRAGRRLVGLPWRSRWRPRFWPASWGSPGSKPVPRPPLGKPRPPPRKPRLQPAA